MMIYVQAIILGPLWKKEKVEENVELRLFHLNPRRGHISQAPPPPLYNAPKTSKALWRKKIREPSVQSGTSG